MSVGGRKLYHPVGSYGLPMLYVVRYSHKAMLVVGITQIRAGVRVESCKIVFIGAHFLFTCSYTFAVGCSLNHKAQHHRQTDRQTTS